MIEVSQGIHHDMPGLLKDAISGIEQHHKCVVGEITSPSRTPNVITEIRDEGGDFMSKSQPALVELSNDRIIDFQRPGLFFEFCYMIV